MLLVIDDTPSFILLGKRVLTSLLHLPESHLHAVLNHRNNPYKKAPAINAGA